MANNQNQTTQSNQDNAESQEMITVIQSVLSSPALRHTHTGGPGGVWQVGPAGDDGFTLRYSYFPVNSTDAQHENHFFRVTRNVNEIRRNSPRAVHRYFSTPNTMNSISQSAPGFSIAPISPQDNSTDVWYPLVVPQNPGQAITAIQSSHTGVSIGIAHAIPDDSQMSIPGGIGAPNRASHGIANGNAGFSQLPQVQISHADVQTSFPIPIHPAIDQNTSLHTSMIFDGNQDWSQLPTDPTDPQDEADQN